MTQEKLVNIKLNDIRPNPNRDLKFNPFNEEKIAALMASIGETGFWTNVIVRKAPDGKGYEQAYGHHRIESAKRSGITEADFVVRDLDENMMLKMMELENQEDYRYCPLSLLESVKAVVTALDKGRIGPFMQQAATVKGLRYAPSFIPQNGRSSSLEDQKLYTAADVARFLGRTYKHTREGAQEQVDWRVVAALDALYLLEVKAISTASIKDMNWSQLGKFVANIKAKREHIVIRETKTKEEKARIREENLRVEAERKAKMKAVEEARKATVKALAEAETERKTKELKTVLKKQVEQQEEITEAYVAKKKALEKRVEEVKQKETEAKQEDAYLPIRKEAERIVHLLERREEEEVVKALARKNIQPAERERLRQAALAKGTWYTEWVAQQFLPPLSVKKHMELYRSREETKRRAEEKETK